jgi:hypothetical protein
VLDAVPGGSVDHAEIFVDRLVGGAAGLAAINLEAA